MTTRALCAVPCWFCGTDDNPAGWTRCTFCGHRADDAPNH